MKARSLFAAAGLAGGLLLPTLCSAAVIGEIAGTPLRTDLIAPPQQFAVSASQTALGRQIFFDTRLSEPQGTSCASCHDPAKAFSGNNGSSKGVAQGSRKNVFALRNAPSLTYVRYVPPQYFFRDDDSVVPEVRGGLFEDGHADTLAEQVLGPLFNPLEMNNRSHTALAQKLVRAPYAAALKAEFGTDALATPKQAMKTVGLALQAYLQSDELSPFSSRYDAYIRHQATLSEQELRGLRLFKNPDKGNCASCHLLNETATNPTRSLFTDYGYDAIAVPRNRASPANARATFNDLGLCDTARAKHWPEPEQWCGYFRTPSLRNVAARERYMHNGVFGNLRETVAFYATRATDPYRWYRDGVKFNDLPAQYREQVNINSSPYNRREGSVPAINDAEIDDIVAFLRTLTDKPFVEAKSSAPEFPKH